jgi:metallo-beta-lactamase class B
MFGKWMIPALLVLTGCAQNNEIAPETSLITETKLDSRSQGAALAQACEGRDGWSDPAPPAHVFANVYMVGTCGITALLITTRDGHFLIDGATAEAADGIADNIRKLGFDPKDIRVLLITHEHLDHAGGMSRLKQITQSDLAVRQPAAAVMVTGLPQSDDPQHGLHAPFPTVQADMLIADGDIFQIGETDLKAIATPGHSPGGTSYTWNSCEGKTCRTFVYADSLNAVSADDYRFSDHPDYVATLRSSMAKIEALKDCDIMISPHPFQSDFFDRLAGEKPLIDPAMCKKYVSAARKRLDDRLAKEAEATKAAQ